MGCTGRGGAAAVGRGGGGGREPPEVTAATTELLMLLMLASAILVWMDVEPSLLVLVRGGGLTAMLEGGRHCMKGC